MDIAAYLKCFSNIQIIKALVRQVYISEMKHTEAQTLTDIGNF